MNGSPNPGLEPRDVSQRLHASVAQQLTAASMIAHVLTERLDAKSDPEAAIAHELMEKLNLASTQLRDIMIEYADQRSS